MSIKSLFGAGLAMASALAIPPVLADDFFVLGSETRVGSTLTHNAAPGSLERYPVDHFSQLTPEQGDVIYINTARPLDPSYYGPLQLAMQNGHVVVFDGSALTDPQQRSERIASIAGVGFTAPIVVFGKPENRATFNLVELDGDATAVSFETRDDALVRSTRQFINELR